MKKLIITLMLLITLVGCHIEVTTVDEVFSVDDITTFDEIIKDGKVVLDGVKYDIKRIRKVNYKYNDQGNILETITENNGKYVKTEYIYDHDLLLQKNTIVDDEKTMSIKYKYEGQKLTRQDTIIDTLFQYTEFEYDGNIEKAMYYDKDGLLFQTTIHEYNNEGKVLLAELIKENGSNYYTEFIYKNGLLYEEKTYRNDQVLNISNYEYNNLGDEIIKYAVIYNNDSITLSVTFTEYEYNDELVPVNKKTYLVFDPIDEANVRKY